MAEPSSPHSHIRRPHWKAAVGLLRVSSAVDRAHQLWSRLRSLVVLSLAAERFLDFYNDYAYGRHRGFRSASRTELIWWERAAIERHFPRPPARVLVGGAGAGREAFALAAMGYEVTAFEPSPSLLGALVAECRPGTPVTAYRGSYQGLPRLESVPSGVAVDLASREPFDAVILGFGSFSHLRTEGERIATLRSIREITAGPILISFIDCRDGAEGRAQRWIRRLPGRLARDPGNIFSLELGFYHLASPHELESDCSAAGLRIGYSFMARERHTSPHAVLHPT